MLKVDGQISVSFHSDVFCLAKKTSVSYQRAKFTQVKESLNAAEQFDRVDETSSTDEEELIASVSPLSSQTNPHFRRRFTLHRDQVNYN